MTQMTEKLKPYILNLRFYQTLLKVSSSLLLLLAILTLSSCSTSLPKQYPENQLEFKILRFREGYKGITNRFCTSWGDENKCLTYGVKEYDLDKVEVRELFNQLSFICKVAGKRYKINKETAELRRDTTYKCGLFKMKTCWNSEYLHIDSSYLRDLGAKCFSSNKYPFGQM